MTSDIVFIAAHLGKVCRTGEVEMVALCSVSLQIARVAQTPRRDQFPAQRSAGEQQRVAIARAIVKKADVLLCDEPAGSLVLEVIARINAELGTTVVVITHSAAIAGRADRVVCLGDGGIQRVEANAHEISPSELRSCGRSTVSCCATCAWCGAGR